MKSILLLFWGLLLTLSAFSQRGLFVNDSAGGIRVMPSTFIYIDGDFQLLKTFPNPINKLINGEIYITNDLVTNDSLYCDKQDSVAGVKASKIHFVGSTDSHIRGTQIPQLYQLIVNKTAGNLYIDNTISVLDTIQFIAGNAIIDTNIQVKLKYRTGTTYIDSKPYLYGENALHRFLGEGILYTKFSIADSHDISVANTGFYFHGHQSDTLELKRGHKKLLYAGNGSVDRYFDVKFTGTTSAFHDTVSVKYLGDEDYSLIGVDTNNLGLFVSAQFQDMDFRRIQADNVSFADSLSIIDGTQFSFPTVNVSPSMYRLAIADTACTQLPTSTLPDTLLHICAGDSLYVQALNAPNAFPTVCYWEDGSQNPNRFVSALATSQTIALELIDARGCSTRDTVYIAPTAPSPVALFTWDDACLGDSVYFYNGSSISSGTFTSNWNFGNSVLSSSSDSTQGVFYAASGNYTASLVLTSNFGCVADTSNVVDVFNHPTAQFNLVENCLNDGFAVDASASIGTTVPSNSIITNYKWLLNNSLLPNNTPSYFLNSPPIGNYDLALIVTSGVGCTDTLHQAFTVFAEDTAGFTVSDACVGQPLSLVNTSLIVNANPVYNWWFSDGTTSNDMNPIKSFASPGIKTIQLIVTTDANCADTISTWVTINALPNSDFSVIAACEQALTTFVPDSIDNLNTYSWDFGDASNSSQITPQHSYSTDGGYTVVLTVLNPNGCSTQSTQTQIVYPQPVAAFSATNVCLGNATSFVSNATGVGLTYNWNFGDFSPVSTLQNPTHTYASASGFTTQLIVTDNNTCADTVAQVVSVLALPFVNMGNPSTCGSSYVLNAQNAGSTYLWSPGNETTQSVTINQSGNYSVIITAANGCAYTANSNVTLNSIVTADLGNDTASCGALLLDALYPGSDFLWQDGSTNQTLSAGVAGTYWVEITDMNGCIGSDTVEVLAVYPPAVPDLGADQTVCASVLPITLDPGVFTNYQWNTSDQTATIQVSASGVYMVDVTSANGCTAADTIVIQALPVPVTTLVDNLVACDNATLTAATNAGYSYLWNDGNTSQIRTVTQSGIYSVIATNILNGCITNDTTAVIINASPNVDLGPNISVCSNSPITLDVSVFSPAIFEWISTSNAVLSTGPTYTPTSSGTYVVNVDNNGCIGSDAIDVTLLPAPVIAEHPPVYYICGTTPVVLNASPFGTNAWTSTTGFTSQDLSIEVYESGNYYVTSQVASCTVTDTFQLTVSPNQIQAFYLVDSDTSKNLELQFIDLSEPTPLTYLWDFGDGTFDTIANPIHEYSMVDTFYTSLTVSNGICISRFEKEINQKFFSDSAADPVAQLNFNNVLLFPNPTTASADLVIELNDYAEVSVIFFDPLGNILETMNESGTKNVAIHYDTASLAAGVYFIRVSAESLKGKVTENLKLIKTSY
jgi:PKD repeat protein